MRGEAWLGMDRHCKLQVRCEISFANKCNSKLFLSLYTYSLSVALQALTVISMGGIADHREPIASLHPYLCLEPSPLTASHRKPLLLCFAAMGSIAAILFLFLSSSSSAWYLSSILAVVANVGFGASVVAMNAYLPSLAEEAPDVVSLRHQLEFHNSSLATSDGDLDVDTSLENSSLLPDTVSLVSEERKKMESQYQTVLARETSQWE